MAIFVTRLGPFTPTDRVRLQIYRCDGLREQGWPETETNSQPEILFKSAPVLMVPPQALSSNKCQVSLGCLSTFLRLDPLQAEISPLFRHFH